MQNKKKILLIESEMIRPKGHFLDYLIETSNYFKSENDIIWFLNKNFDNQKVKLPKFCNIKKIILSNSINRKKNRFLYLLEEAFFFIKNFYYIFYFFLFFINNKKKLFSYIKCLVNNYLIVPRYFKSFYLEYLKMNFNSNDNIIFQSCRRKDISLVYFLSNIEIKNLPKIHLRFFQLPNKRFKGFLYYVNLLKNMILKKKIFLYTEEGYKYNFLYKDLQLGELINVTKPTFTFYNRKNNIKNHTVGFIGDARMNKGFNKIPELIKIMNLINPSIEFIIHTNDIETDTKDSFNKIIQLNSIHKNINIINKYLDYEDYRELLKKITIMPLMYDLDQINLGSGVLYSCISHEIIPIIPTNSFYLDEVLVSGSYLTAINTNEYTSNIQKITKNYNQFLSRIKISSQNLKETINNDILIKNIRL